MLTKQENKNIRQELSLQRDNLTLLVTEINNNNSITPIPNGGLTFNKMNAREGVEITKVNRIHREFSPQNISPDNKVDVSIQKAVNSYFKIHRTDPKNTKFSAVKYDLNGNGFDDAIVLLDWCSAKLGCEMLIFEGHKTGYRFSSRISRIHAPIIVSKTQHHQWQGLLFKHASGWSQLKFNGLSYPTHSSDLEVINKEDYSTGVVLFNQGKPTQWFPIEL